MSTTALVIVVIVAVIVIAAAVIAWSVARRNSLRQQFGDEYEEALDTAGSRRLAEAELRERQRRHQALSLKPWSDESRQTYTAQWQEIQGRFVDDPSGSLAAADALVTAVIAERGYPTDDFDQQLSHLSVEHAATLPNYRAAHAVTGADGPASTEDLRQALVDYRSVFSDLLGIEPDDVSTIADGAAPVDATAVDDVTPVDAAAVDDVTPVDAVAVDDATPVDAAVVDATPVDAAVVDATPVDAAVVDDADADADFDTSVAPDGAVVPSTEK
jgi:hypothetical protein